MEFRILGPLEAEHAGTAIAIGSPRERTLLALLLLSANQVVSVDRLTEELWEGVAPERAVASLRVHVSRLRKVLESAGDRSDRIVTRAPGYVLGLGAGELDAARFEAAAEQARRHRAGGDPAAAAEALRQALAIWRGPALADVADRAFATPEVTRLEEARLAALEERVDADLACGRHAELVGELEALVAEHPLRERLWGQRMVALYRCGRQAEALRAYTELRELLGEELGIEPTAALRRLEEAILLQRPELDWESGPVPPSAAAPTPTPAPAGWLPVPLPLPPAVASLRAPTFVGRTTELAVFEAVLQRGAEGQRQVVLLAGDPGIGKTASAAEMAAYAHEQGWSALYGRCDEETLLPFQPFVEAIRYCLETADPAAVELELGPHLADLARVVPLALGAAATTVPARSIDAPTEQYRLFEAVAATLRSATLVRPLVLVLDDLQWADRSTLSLLHYLARPGSLTSVVVLGTFRHTDVSDGHPLTTMLADLRREYGITRLRLSGLKAHDVTEVLPAWRQTGPRPDDPALASALLARTEGNPLFMQALLAEAEAPAAVAEQDPVSRLQELGVPEGIQEVILRQVARLTGPARGLLEVAAVMGQEFRAEVIARVGELPPSELDDAIEETIRAGLLTEASGHTGHYAFAHALVRETLYESRTATRQQRAHAQVAHTLEELFGHDPAWLPELAHHHLRAVPLGDSEKAVSYAQRAGDQALASLAFEGAGAFYASALSLVERSPDAPAVTTAELLLGIAAAHLGAGENERAADAFERAASVADAHRLAELQGQAALGYEEASYAARGFAIDPSARPAVDLLQRALRTLEGAETSTRALVLSRLPRQLSYTAPPEQRIAYADEAMELAERLGDPALRAAALNGRAWALLGPDNVEDRLAVATDLVEEAERAGDGVHRFWGHVWRFEAYFELGHTVGVEEELEALDVVSQELQTPFYLWWVAVYRAAYGALKAPTDEAERLAADAFAVGGKMESSIAIQIFGIQLFFVRFHQGGLAELEGPVRGLATREPFMPSSQVGLTFLLAQTGAMSEARARFGLHASEGFTSIHHTSAWSATMLHLAEACVSLEDAARARELHELLAPYADRNIAAGIGIAFGGPVARLLGMLSHVMGDYDAAEGHFASALDMCERMGADVWGAHIRKAYAATLAARGRAGDADRAAVLGEEALAAAQRLGLRRLL